MNDFARTMEFRRRFGKEWGFSADPEHSESWLKQREENPSHDGDDPVEMRYPRMLVFDLDRKGGKDGVTAFYGFCRSLGVEVPPSWVVKTKSGGLHIYFILPPGVNISLNANLPVGGEDVLSGVEVKTEHIRSPYEPGYELDMLGLDQPAELPAKWVEYLEEDEKRRGALLEERKKKAASRKPNHLDEVFDRYNAENDYKLPNHRKKCFTGHGSDWGRMPGLPGWWMCKGDHPSWVGKQAKDGSWFGDMVDIRAYETDPDAYEENRQRERMRVLQEWADDNGISMLPSKTPGPEVVVGDAAAAWAAGGTDGAGAPEVEIDGEPTEGHVQGRDKTGGRLVTVVGNGEPYFIAKNKAGLWSMKNVFKAKSGVFALQDMFGWGPKKSTAIIASGETLRVGRIGQFPDNVDIHDEPDTIYPTLNINQHPVPEPLEGEWPLIRKILEHLCSKEGPELVEHVLNWAAFCTQNPSTLPQTAIVVWGGQGAGKTILGTLMGYCRGSWAAITNDDLISHFNMLWATAGFIIASEIMLGDAKNEYSQRLKALITDQTLRVEEKNIAAYHADNVKAWWITSNSATPVVLERGDRRYNVIQAPEETPAALTEEMRRTFGEWDGRFHLWPQLRAFRYYLLHRPVNRIAVQVPFDTEARRNLLNSSMPSIEEFHGEVVSQGFVALWREHMPGCDPEIFSGKAVAVSKIYNLYKKFAGFEGKMSTGLRKASNELRSRFGWTDYRSNSAVCLVPPKL